MPARTIRELESTQCVEFKNDNKYHGYINSNDFEMFRIKKLRIESYHKIREKIWFESKIEIVKLCMFSIEVHFLKRGVPYSKLNK